MTPVYLSTITLFALIANSHGVYESIFCESCPLTLGSQCQEPQYTCKCACSVGCTINNGTTVKNGATASLIDIKSVAQVLQPCSSCLIFWFAWDCKDATTSMNINTCDHYNDYNKYKTDCLTSPLLHFLEVDILVNMLSISNRFLPKHLWTWVDQVKAQSKDEQYMQQVKQKLFDSWKAFQVTGHGAIELGLFVYPNELKKAPFGKESRRVNATTMFLKMNVDEYKQLVTYTREILGSNINLSSPTIVIVDESGQPVDDSPRRYSPYPPPPSQPTNGNDTSVDIGVGAAFSLAWYYILAICLGGLILIAVVIALISVTITLFCCCCQVICCC